MIRTASLRVRGLGKLVWLATNAFELARVFRTFEPDVVVTLGLSNSLIAIWMAKAARVPVVVHLIDALHTLVEPKALRLIAARVERAILRRADRVVVINKALGVYAERMRADPEHIEVIPTGADIERFGPHVDGSAVRNQLGIRPNDTVMLFVGWLYTFSGLRELAQAMAAESDLDPRLRLLIVGDGDLMADLRRLRDESLGDRLILTGAQPAALMPQFVAASDICLLPAHANATMRYIVPAKIYEYLAAGKPVIASRLAGLVTEFGYGHGLHYAGDSRQVLLEARRLAANVVAYMESAAQARRVAEASGSWANATERFGRVLAGTAFQDARACAEVVPA